MNSNDDFGDEGIEADDSVSAGEKKKKKKKQSYKDRMREILDAREDEFYDEGEE